MKLNDDYESVRSQILAMDPLPTVNKAYYIVQQIEKQKQVTNHSFEPTTFFANLNNKGANNGRKDNRGSRNDGKNDGKRFCTGCNQEGHTVDQCFEKIGYPDCYKGKKAKKQGRMAANVSSGFDDHFSVDTPFDMSYENEIGTSSGGGVDQRLVATVCQEMMKMFKGKGGDNSVSRDQASTSHACILSCCTASFTLFCHPHMNIEEDWIKDTWASDYMTPNFDLFISVTHLKNPIIVHLTDGNSKTVTIVGKVQLTPSLILTNVFYDPSTKQIVVVRKGLKYLYICKPTIDPIAFSARISEFQASHLNFIPSTSLSKDSFSNSVSKNVLDVNTFHARLGHSPVSKLLPFLKSDSSSPTHFHLIHVHLWGPYKQDTLKDEHYFFTIVDDNGTKIINKTCASFFQAHGVLHQKSIAHTPQQNGRVERKHRYLLDTARAIRLYGNLPLNIWDECILTATYLINKMSVKLLDWKSPFEKLYGKSSTYDHLRVLGCLCYAADIRPHKDKFDNRCIKSVLIGYTVNQKGYKLYNWETKEIFLSRDVVFKENVFPFRQNETPTIIQSSPIYPSFKTHDEEVTEHVNPNTPLSAEPNISDTTTDNSPTSNHATGSTTSTPYYPLFVSSEFKNIPQPHIAFLANVFANSEPTSYAQAVKEEGWVRAMEDELAALERNQTWTVTSLPKGHKPITSK
ncbi:retrovirus-related pol polyprotein from transposon TNT 1-94 [Tanacetum coccineum]|uniref:Retrovirus-related pol polyprotein from transposon TNT 1-94 n=1 Tax=Tanacetum coccineum TaxID=301880 RepID=A0ABQ4XS15_9ASTR